MTIVLEPREYIYLSSSHNSAPSQNALARDRPLSSHRHRLFLRRRSYYSIFCCTTPTMIIVRSGSDTAVGPRRWNEDEHLLIDDVSSHLGSLYRGPVPNPSFYAVLDGHGGTEAATYLKDNAMRFFFEDVDLPHTDDDDSFLKELEDSHQSLFAR
ncbi:putative protein phosphatase 2C 2 [Camellia lanceoleosa]|nr:putative protein phosphatase 2C 2 [Camellia lanceoleosa]